MHDFRKKINASLGACLALFLLALATFAEAASGETAASIRFLKRVEVGQGARPEVVAAKDRVFAVYLDTAEKGNPSFSVKIFDKDMNKEISHKILVSSSQDYGRPTDIRVASDGSYMYAFYETLVMGRKAYLWGAKYSLDDGFNKAAATASPIASGPMFTRENLGDEIVNDPIPLIGPESVFVITRIKQRSFSKESSMVYRVREFSKDLRTKLNEFDLDLSLVAHGEGRQASVLYQNDLFYMVVPTTSESGEHTLDMITPSNLLLITLDKKWKITGAKALSREPGVVETFVTGFKAHDGLLYITYKHGRKGLSGWDFESPLKVFDSNGNNVFSTVVKKASGRGESLRSSLDIAEDRIYVGHSAGQGPPPPMAPGNRGSDARGRGSFPGQGGPSKPFPGPGGRGDFQQRPQMMNSGGQAGRDFGNQKAEVYIYEY